MSSKTLYLLNKHIGTGRHLSLVHLNLAGLGMETIAPFSDFFGNYASRNIIDSESFYELYKLSATFALLLTVKFQLKNIKWFVTYRCLLSIFTSVSLRFALT